MDVEALSGSSNYLDQIAARIVAHIKGSVIPPDSASLFRVYAVLLLAVGEDVRDEDVHNAWVAWMLDRESDHRALVQFEDLDGETAQADRPFRDAVRLVALELGHGGTHPL